MIISQNSPTRRFVFILLLIGFVLFLYKVGDRDLWAPDEDEYAQMSREMIRTGNWMFPTVNGEPWTIKPALYNWLVSAVSLPYGDVDEFRARVFSSLSAIGTVIVTFFIGRIAFSPVAGFMGALVLATSLLFLYMGRWAQTTMMSTFFATLAIYLFYRGYKRADKRTVSYLLMYAAAGLGVLTMGPVNLVIPGLVGFVFLVAEKDLKHIKDVRLGWGILIFLLIALPWYVLVCLQDSYGFDLLVKTNLSRYFDTWAHPQPFYYYFKDIAWAFAPWSLFLPVAIHLVFSDRSKEDYKDLKFLMIWVVSIFVFFSFGKGKRPQYILSIYPALALIVGYLGSRAVLFWQDKYYKKAIIIPSYIFMGLLMLITVSLPLGTWFYMKPFFGEAIGLSAIAGIISVMIWFAARKKQAFKLVVLPVAFIIIFALYGAQFIIPKVEPFKSPRPFCEQIVARVDNGADWAMYQFYRAAYVYYTDSFAKVLESEDELERFLDKPTQSVVAMKEKVFNQLPEPFKKKVYIVYKQAIGHRPMVLISNQKE